MKVLVVAAHPDDEVLGCGATIPRLSERGDDVYIVILGEGVTSRYSTREDADPELVERIHAQSREAAKILRARDVRNHLFPDNRFDTVPLLDVVKTVEEEIARAQPKVVYTHFGGDLNIDHQITNRAVVTATRPMKGQPVRDVYAFEVPSSTEWAFGHSALAFRPNLFEDVTETLELKLKAFSLYESEQRDYPHPRSQEALTAIARRWGSVIGCDAAEAFELIRSVHVGEP